MSDFTPTCPSFAMVFPPFLARQQQMAPSPSCAQEKTRPFLRQCQSTSPHKRLPRLWQPWRPAVGQSLNLESDHSEANRAHSSNMENPRDGCILINTQMLQHVTQPDPSPPTCRQCTWTPTETNSLLGHILLFPSVACKNHRYPISPIPNPISPTPQDANTGSGFLRSRLGTWTHRAGSASYLG